jgi:predicted transcriptional regulator
MNILLSIKPEYAQAILDEKKRFEFRRVIFKDKSVKTVVMYASYPLKKIVGEFDVDGIISVNTEELWVRTESYAGISRAYYDDYFRNRIIGNAIIIGGVKKYCEQKELSSLNIKRAPQSFMYI